MQRFLLIVVILVAMAAGYLYLGNTPTPTAVQPQQAFSPPPAVVEPAPPSEQAVAEAKAHINQITAPPEQSISIESADHFVTASQLIDIPEQQMKSSVQLEQVTRSDTKTFAIDTGIAVSAPGFTGKIIIPEGNQIKLLELLDVPVTNKKQVYYIHAVNDGDEQGLWGILQVGLTRTFAEGIQLEGHKDKLYVDIPKSADEKENGARSSFLGTLLKDKVDSTYIYNYRSGNLGDDPNLILPGQQLIIVSFTENELIRVYNHFVNL